MMKPRTRKAVFIPLIVAGVLLVAAAAVLVPGYLARADWISVRGCDEGALRPGDRPDQPAPPYGEVRSCRVLDRRTPVFGEPDCSAYLILETEQGLVAVRSDYHDIDQGRYYTAAATELAPADVPPGLSDAERVKLAEDVTRRGGVKPDPWTLHYGV